jgi:hypothetical protein
LEAPSIRQRRIDFSRVESCGASVFSVLMSIAWLFSARPRRGGRLRDRERMTEMPAGKLFHPSSPVQWI